MRRPANLFLVLPLITALGLPTPVFAFRAESTQEAGAEQDLGRALRGRLDYSQIRELKLPDPIFKKIQRHRINTRSLLRVAREELLELRNPAFTEEEVQAIEKAMRARGYSLPLVPREPERYPDSIVSLGLSPHAVAFLRRHQMDPLSKLLATPRERLLSLRGMGPTIYHAVDRGLFERGLYLPVSSSAPDREEIRETVETLETGAGRAWLDAASKVRGWSSLSRPVSWGNSIPKIVEALVQRILPSRRVYTGSAMQAPEGAALTLRFLYRNQPKSRKLVAERLEAVLDRWLHDSSANEAYLQFVKDGIFSKESYGRGLARAIGRPQVEGHYHSEADARDWASSYLKELIERGNAPEAVGEAVQELRKYVDVFEIRRLFARLVSLGAILEDSAESLAVSEDHLKLLKEELGVATVGELLRHTKEEIESKIGSKGVPQLEAALAVYDKKLESQDSIKFLNLPDPLQAILYTRRIFTLSEMQKLGRVGLRAFLKPRELRLLENRLGDQGKKLGLLPAEPRGVLRVRVRDLASAAPRVAAAARKARKTWIALVPADGTSAEEKTLAALYAHLSVAPAALTLLPEGAGKKGLRVEVLPEDDPDQTSRLLSDAAYQFSKGDRVVIALDGTKRKRWALPKEHPLTLLLDPATWHKIQPEAVQAYLSAAGHGSNLILDLTRGSVFKVTIEGRDYFTTFV